MCEGQHPAPQSPDAASTIPRTCTYARTDARARAYAHARAGTCWASSAGTSPACSGSAPTASRETSGAPPTAQAAIEPLRLANYVAGKPLYEWLLAGETGDTATCSNGATFKLDIGLEEIDRDDIVLVCGGLDIQRTTTRPVVSWLRREARRGITIGGMCTGSYTLARAGLLAGVSGGG